MPRKFVAAELKVIWGTPNPDVAVALLSVMAFPSTARVDPRVTADDRVDEIPDEI
jgi:hypothetical protein